MASTVWKGQLTFGLVSVPVRLQRAARRERIRMHYVAEAPRDQAEIEPANDDASEDPREFSPPVERVSQQLHTPSGERGVPVPRAELLQAHEVEPDRYVTFRQPELRVLRPKTSAEIEIVRAVHLTEIDPVYFDASYYVIPDRGGERGYALLFSALKASGYVTLAKMAMHGREHILTVRPGEKGLIAHTMFYSDEVRGTDEFDARTVEAGEKELKLAQTFIDAIAGPFAPEEFRDSYREKLKELIAGKVAREEVAAGAGAQRQAAGGSPPFVDLMEALRQSIERTEQPERRGPARVTQMPRREPKRRGSGSHS